MSLNLIKYAKEVEERALDSYLHNTRVLRLSGIDLKDLEDVVKKVSIETWIHKEIVAGMLKAYQEALDRVVEVMRDVESITPTTIERAVLVKILKEHLQIEADMIETYKKLANELKYPVLKAIAEALARNEEEHHKMISDLIRKYEAM
ncbi:MAG: ferritin family protein [Sulfolobales archaeon]